MRDRCVRGKLLEPDGANLALTVLRDYFAPDALDAVHQEVVHFSSSKRTTQTMDNCMVKIDLFRKVADGRLQPGGISPGAFAAEWCSKKASLHRADKSSMVSSTLGSLGILEFAQHVSRLFGPMGGSRR